MKVWGVAALAAMLAGSGAMAADYTNIVLEKNVNASAETVWKKVGDFCALKEWMKLPDCTYSSGAGDIGTVRTLRTAKAASSASRKLSTP